MEVAQTRVWDPFVRIFHWLLATAVLLIGLWTSRSGFRRGLAILRPGWSFSALCGDLSDQRMLDFSAS